MQAWGKFKVRKVVVNLPCPAENAPPTETTSGEKNHVREEENLRYVDSGALLIAVSISRMRYTRRQSSKQKGSAGILLPV
jgi:hypothetical protein